MNISHHYPALVVVLPIIATVLIPVLGRINRALVWPATVLVMLLDFGMAIDILARVMDTGVISYHLAGWKPPVGIEYRIDLLNGFMLAVMTFIGVVSALYMKTSVEAEIEEHRRPAFYSVFMLFMLGLFGILLTGDIFNLYVFLEITSLAGYGLIAMGRKKFALMAAFNYLILGTIAATFILIGVGYLYMVTGTLNMVDLAERLAPVYNTTVVHTAFAFMAVGLMLKMAIFPLHFWLPDAYAYSPNAVTGAIAATSTKVGAYIMIRVMFTVFRVQDHAAGPVLELFVVIASVAIIAGSVLAIAQTDLKKMLAFSSVGQIGYIALAASLLHPVALAGGIVHVLNHALMKGALFFVAGNIGIKKGTLTISDLKGAGRTMPWTAGAFVILALSIIGVPLTVGFVSKWYLVSGAMMAGHWYVIGVVLLSSLLTAVYFGRVVNVMFFQPANDGEHHDHAPAKRDEAHWSLVAPTVIVAILCIVFGIFATTPVDISLDAARQLFDVAGGVAWK